MHGGPAGGRTLPLPDFPAGQWPEYTCVNISKGPALAAHYRHIAAGVFEYQGACLEFDHKPGAHVRRCPDCGSQILGHPEEGHRG